MLAVSLFESHVQSPTKTFYESTPPFVPNRTHRSCASMLHRQLTLTNMLCPIVQDISLLHMFTTYGCENRKQLVWTGMLWERLRHACHTRKRDMAREEKNRPQLVFWQLQKNRTPSCWSATFKRTHQVFFRNVRSPVCVAKSRKNTINTYMCSDFYAFHCRRGPIESWDVM